MFVKYSSSYCLEVKLKTGRCHTLIYRSVLFNVLTFPFILHVSPSFGLISNE